MTVAEGCPAFTGGCPFSILKTDHEALPKLMTQLPQGVTEKCPAFQEGCPFKASDSVEALYNKLSEMPATHRIGEDSEAAKVVAYTLRKVHELSKDKRAMLNSECPVFATSCPFKTVTSDGQPLVQQLDDMLTSWSLGAAGTGEAGNPVPAEGRDALSMSLKKGTRSVHRAAENVRFVRDFLRGEVPKESYVALLRALHQVYSTLESALDSLPEPLQHIDFEVLRREETLAADIRYFTGLPADAPLPAESPSAGASQYVEHLKRLAHQAPYLLLAHAYTRYLGDLSGGQILARVAIKTYSLPAGKGVDFYSFGQVGSTTQEVKAFKKSYRASLDALRLSAEEADAMVAEANKAFIMNMLLFEERDFEAGHLDRVRDYTEVLAMVEKASSPLEFQKAYGGSGQPASQAARCPFLPDLGSSAGSVRPAGRGETPRGTCPWPFVWLHDPRAALAHPVKNSGFLLVLLGVIKAAWRHPRRGLSLLAVGLLLSLCRPKKKAIQEGRH